MNSYMNSGVPRFQMSESGIIQLEFQVHLSCIGKQQSSNSAGSQFVDQFIQSSSVGLARTAEGPQPIRSHPSAWPASPTVRGPSTVITGIPHHPIQPEPPTPSQASFNLNFKFTYPNMHRKTVVIQFCRVTVGGQVYPPPKTVVIQFCSVPLQVGGPVYPPSTLKSSRHPSAWPAPAAPPRDIRVGGPQSFEILSIIHPPGQRFYTRPA